MLLCGEYAVLEGAPALVAAVTPLATATWDPGAVAADGLVDLVLGSLRPRLATLGATIPPGAPRVDTAAMRHPTDNRKRGLGSSAAAAAAAAGAASLAAGLDPADKATRALLAEAATEAHIAHQGGIGSGADVAACVHGGVIRFARGEGATAVEPAAAIPWAVVEVGPGGASSVEMVRAVMASDPRRRGRSMLELAEAASEAAAAYAIGRTTRFLQWIEAFRDACDRLGTDAGVPIVTAKDRRLAEIARRHGGAAKPSGAGGGELAIVFAPSDPALEAILAAATEAGAPGASGVEPDSQGLRRAR